MVTFCPKCKSLLLPKEEKGKKVIACSCGYKEKGDMSIRDSTHAAHNKEMAVVGEEDDTMALSVADDEQCPKCGKMGVFYWFQQTRAADEGETRFFKCKHCSHGWREY